MLVRRRFEHVTFRSADLRSPNWANQGQQLSWAIGTRRSRAQDKWGISLLPLLRTSVFIYAHFNCVTSRWHPLQDIRALWKSPIATILRKSVDCQNSVGFNVKCSQQIKQVYKLNALLCPVHYHSFKKFSSNVRPTLFILSICYNLLSYYVLPIFYIFKLLQLVQHFLPFFQSDSKYILNRLTSKGPLLLDLTNTVLRHFGQKSNSMLL